VRVWHPEADPDPYHWFALRWLGRRATPDREVPAPRLDPTESFALAHLEAHHS
jgi:hypothetical protein